MKTQLEIPQKQMNTMDNALRETESGKEESFAIKDIQRFNRFLRKRLHSCDIFS